MLSRNKLQPLLLINHASVQERSRKNKSIIFHVDMNHFFTAFEAREHPEYREKALIGRACNMQHVAGQQRLFA
jgi:hypothetical protein